MLTKAYAALQQIQSQISGINTIDELKTQLRKNQLGMTVWLAVPTVLILNWEFLEDEFSGNLEIQLQPKFTKDGETIEGNRSTLRVEGPKGITIKTLEKNIINILKESIRRFS